LSLPAVRHRGSGRGKPCPYVLVNAASESCAARFKSGWGWQTFILVAWSCNFPRARLFLPA